MVRSGLALALLVVASAAVGAERPPCDPVPELDLARYDEPRTGRRRGQWPRPAGRIPE